MDTQNTNLIKGRSVDCASQPSIPRFSPCTTSFGRFAIPWQPGMFSRHSRHRWKGHHQAFRHVMKLMVSCSQKPLHPRERGWQERENELHNSEHRVRGAEQLSRSAHPSHLMAATEQTVEQHFGVSGFSFLSFRALPSLLAISFSPLKVPK